MRMVDLIQKKRDGLELTDEEIHFIIDGYTKDIIPDYQMSAWMMAICFQGLNKRETASLTLEMMHSGDIIDLSAIQGIKADKHSTGGVGDKTSVVLGPIVAACGVPGDGAFMKTIEDAKVLARTMIEIGESLGKDTRATISNMSQPLGNAIGNSLEVKEAIETLNGNGPEDLLELCLQAGSHMLVQAKKTDSELIARQMLEDTITSKKALHVLCAMVKAQGGDDEYIKHPGMFEKAKEVIAVRAEHDGYVKELEALSLGLVSMKLGGGRQTTKDQIDHSVGLVLNKKIGDFVKRDDVLVYVHTNTGLSEELKNEILGAYHFTNDFVKKPILIDEILS